MNYTTANVSVPNDQLLQPMYVKRKLMSERNVGISTRYMWQHSNMYVLVCLHGFFILIKMVRIDEWAVWTRVSAGAKPK